MQAQEPQPMDALDRVGLRGILRVPLLAKLVVLDVAINLAALIVMRKSPPDYIEEVSTLSLVLVLILNAALVAWALKPLQVLEETARRVSEGDFAARAQLPALADRNLLRIGDTLNALIDRVTAERGRVRARAAELVATGDRERAHIARELHDGTAQSLSALDMVLASMLADPASAPLRDRLQAVRDIAVDSLAEVRTLSHNVHPRVLDDLGLPAALEFLARRAVGKSGPSVDVEVAGTVELPSTVASVLYRVGLEAVHNAIRHASAHRIRVMLEASAERAILRVVDDGRGFDRAAVDERRRGIGLFVMEERVSLVDGHLQIRSTPGSGTEVRAEIPLEPRPG
jgi:signal transduction histidine kinase